MYITLEKTMPNFALGVKHHMNTVTIKGDMVLATIVSYTASDTLCWSEDITIPYETFVSDPINDVAAYLTATGRYLAGGAITVEATELEALQVATISRIERLRDEHINGGADTPVGRVDTDEISIRNILGTFSAATTSLVTSQPFAIKWRMADNTLVDLDAIAMLGMGTAVLKHVDFCYNRSWVLKDLVNAATTIEELNAINLNEGWIDVPEIEETPTPTTD